MRASEVQPCFKALAPEPDAEDWALHKQNCNPKLVTRRLRELVPLLETVDCVVEEMGPERTVLALPLLASAMNQNGTHQASVFYLVADYTLGVGMFGVLPGCYVTGVHDRCNALPVQYWLKRGDVKHLAPGTGGLRAETRIAPEDGEKLRRQLLEKGRGEYTGIVKISQEGRIVAEATHTMGIYADVPRVAGVRANLFQLQNMKTSALMISGLRQDPISRIVAGDQGRAVANRMALATPQLPSLVRARTLDVERYLGQNGGSFSQVLVLGLGFDPKPVHFANENCKWFGLDLRDMQQERSLRFAAAGAEAANLRPVIGDILSDTWDAAVRDAGFRPDVPSFIIAEGISMYFPREILATTLRKLRELTESPDSRLWLDHVTSGVFDLDMFEVRSFLSTMARLGEPFITGFDDPSTIVPETWVLSETTTAAFTVGSCDPVHNEYRFSLLRPT
jgi:O-methyltransferase involved in polyketide biosynthesis/acyl-coenzyme A thioesterase PaaI-like protein